MAAWNDQNIEAFLKGSTEYIEENFVKPQKKIDCADLALSYLVDYAVANELPVTLMYWAEGGWKYYTVPADAGNAEPYKDWILDNLGALNVIDNSEAIDASDTKEGDLIMSKWSGSSGHTRIVVSSQVVESGTDYIFTFYQGNLPPVVPEKKTQMLSTIDFGELEDKRPRRWKFASF
jgi:hypothetical protein